MYDYLRCPKIVALRTNRDFFRPEPIKKKASRSIPYEIGTIGEMATREILSAGDEEFEGREEFKTEHREERVPRLMELSLAQKGIQLDDYMKGILKETLDGLSSIKGYLEDEYGRIRVLGKAESRNGLLPGTIRPDFIAMSSEMKKPLLIEIKNTKMLYSKPDDFQASYYNSITQKFGVLLLEERVENGKSVIVPKSMHDTLPETLIIYPRLKSYRVVSETVRITPKIVNGIWQAKQLGVLGKTPHTDCDAKCPHHRFGVLPEDNIEAAKPLALIFARALQEQSQDLNTHFMLDYWDKKGIRSELRQNTWEFGQFAYLLHLKAKDPKKYVKTKRKLEQKREEYLDMFSEKSGLSRISMTKLLGERSHIWDQDKKIEKEMSDEIRPWKKMVGRENSKHLSSRVKRFTTGIYALPEKSDRFIKKSWRAWER